MPLLGMQWCKYPLVGMPWCECPLGSVPWCECSDANIIYSKISFIFKTRLSSVPETQKYFQKLDLLFMKSHLLIHFFLLKALQKLVITVRKSPKEALTWNLVIWLNRFIFTIWLSKEVARFHGLFLEKWILWKSSILKDSFFFSL